MPRRGEYRYAVSVERLRELAAQGLTLREIAARLGCGYDTVWKRMKQHDIPRLPAKARPEKNYFWNGGRTVDRDGYVLVRATTHPYATRNGYVREHRLVVEQQLGRYLLPAEVVDHIDGNRGNNDPSNLRVFPDNAAHLAATLKGKVPKWTPEGKARLQELWRRRREPPFDTTLPVSESDAPPSP